MKTQAGIFYARTDEGQDLPIVDVTHPAFRIDITERELDQQQQAHIREVERRSKVPAPLQNAMLRFMMKRSRLMRAITGAEDGYLGGMDTYLIKLGPRQMPKAVASSIDRRISASLPGLSVRLRLQNIAQLLADGLAPLLRVEPCRAVHLLNIGGGPAIDSLNALLILQERDRGLLAERPIVIHILDQDEAGPHFGARALQALQAGGAPLHGLRLSLEYRRYDWSNTAVLNALLQSIGSDVLLAASSEGALFEYGADQVIQDNLQALHRGSPSTAFMVGSVTRADTTGRLLNGASRAALQMRGLEAFETLAAGAGWQTAACLTRPSGHDVSLKER